MPSALDRLFAAYCRACAFAVVLVPVAVVALLVTAIGLDWQSRGPRVVLEPLGATLGFTVAVAACAAALGGSLGIGAAFMSHEYAPGGVRRIVEAATLALRVTPSIGYAWLGAAIIAPLVLALTHGTAAPFTGAVALLTLIEAPTAATLAARALRRIPETVRHAAVAAGATRLQTTVLVLIPALRRRIASAYVACFGRACVEAAALLLLFIAIARLGATPAAPASNHAADTMATLAFALLSHQTPSGASVGVLALAVAVIAYVCALWVDRDFRGRQWT